MARLPRQSQFNPFGTGAENSPRVALAGRGVDQWFCDIGNSSYFPAAWDITAQLQAQCAIGPDAANRSADSQVANAFIESDDFLIQCVNLAGENLGQRGV